MAQDETLDSSAASASGRLNASAPEFTPRSSSSAPPPVTAMPFRRGPQPHHHHHSQTLALHHGEADGEAAERGGHGHGHGLPDDVVRRITKQVEFYFSDVNLATTEHLMKFISKDPEGFVPMSVVASFKKIREVVHDRSLLAAALRTSSELVVSDDGKKVRRQQPFTEADVEEAQARILVAENLPEDHRYQNLFKIFSAAGSVKSIRTCYPQGPDGIGPAVNKSSRIEILFANKLHAFVEYETIEDAEKAVTELGGGSNWRNGLRVRTLLGCLKHAIGRGRKGKDENDDAGEEDDIATTEHPKDDETEDNYHSSEAHYEHQVEENFTDKGGAKHGRGRGRGGRGRGVRGQYNSHGHPVGTPPASHTVHNEQPAVTKPPPGPRMPDGTKGFTMGRGKPLNPINMD